MAEVLIRIMTSHFVAPLPWIPWLHLDRNMTAPARTTIMLFYDVISPYSYIAFETLCRYRQKWNMDIKFRPIVLGSLRKLTGGTSILGIDNKARYLFTDIARCADLYQVPLKVPQSVMGILHGQAPPPGDPQTNKRASVTEPLGVRATDSFPGGIIFRRGSLAPVSYLTAVSMQHPLLTEQLSRAMYEKLWSRCEDITEAGSLLELGSDVGLSEEQAQGCLNTMNTPEVEARLSSLTQEAATMGGFGVPTIVVKDSHGNRQMVFGSDRMEVLAKIIDKPYEGPLPP